MRYALLRDGETIAQSDGMFGLLAELRELWPDRAEGEFVVWDRKNKRRLVSGEYLRCVDYLGRTTRSTSRRIL